MLYSPKHLPKGHIGIVAMNINARHPVSGLNATTYLVYRDIEDTFYIVSINSLLRYKNFEQLILLITTNFKYKLNVSNFDYYVKIFDITIALRRVDNYRDNDTGQGVAQQLISKDIVLKSDISFRRKSRCHPDKFRDMFGYPISKGDVILYKRPLQETPNIILVLSRQMVEAALPVLQFKHILSLLYAYTNSHSTRTYQDIIASARKNTFKDRCQVNYYDSRDTLCIVITDTIPGG